jgi:uncharacterized protein YqfA (UPF0365 family)
MPGCSPRAAARAAVRVLNNISRPRFPARIPDAGDIVGHIQKNFSFDHIGIGILDYVTKDIEIKAEAGITAQALGKRVPAGWGILGRVARTGEAALVQTTGGTDNCRA